MFGFSVYLNNDLTSEDRAYIRKMKQGSFQGVFTSIQIPEENQEKYFKRLQDLASLCKTLQLSLMVDMSLASLEKIGISLDKFEVLTQWGITGIRLDDGFSNEVIAKLSHKIQLGINASTIEENDIKEIIANGANKENIAAWHNYYPRPYTGLGEDYFMQKNHLFHQYGLKVQAFVSGDQPYRGPVYQGLPTLEKLRGKKPFMASLTLLKQYHVDQVYLSDPYLSNQSLEQFSYYIKDGIILLHGSYERNYQSAKDPYLQAIQTCRPDISDYVVRSQFAREKITEEIEPSNQVARNKGSITIDNNLAGRYEGEFEIVKKDLPSDPSVNVIGLIASEDIPLIQFIGSKQKYLIQWR
ncbi:MULTISPECIES: DUF871 domain-containing protein [Aerococcus]|uniref:DUF871 domain-containing protein n=1 Tax=Aerococcus tenax TaxID=3078812 RepID=A0A5N1BQB3_9LACT|nr:MupG family TIM beta-alpha barrel fold protein [Aerococcus urinae]KAA9240359.1 DUF871 domain-containing protein [Aerococcus urinae]MDK7302778.1 MupG family TIM beta-alpha barrel fold protein [Aerococcus urinae]MDK7801438.1 MupG family TIM beta-alpha barrel fold protein [Aerococcus urinae]MDK8655022.1 MupG family TIM beta-alpha barrel fold protein [Aerococcus urinae]RAV70815.1 DUF871 domain-containing protein [Aerococcus urinae]